MGKSLSSFFTARNFSATNGMNIFFLNTEGLLWNCYEIMLEEI